MKAFLKNRRKWREHLQKEGDWKDWKEKDLTRKKVFEFIKSSEPAFEYDIIAGTKEEIKDDFQEYTFPIHDFEFEKYFITEKEKYNKKFNNKVDELLK